MTATEQHLTVSKFLNNTVEFFIEDVLGRPHYYKSQPSKHHDKIINVFPCFNAYVPYDYCSEKKKQSLIVDKDGLLTLENILDKMVRLSIPFSDIHIVASYNLQPNE